ncbi:MAG: HEAT repeat domain-containing protein, partial [Myxococcota bacterium]
EDTGLNSCLRQVLETASFGDVKERALMNLGHRQDQEAVALITAQLDDNDAAVRRSAAWALARIGLPAAESARGKLAEILPETNEVDRSQVLWTLAVLRTQDDAVLGTLIEAFSQGQIQTLDGFEPRIVADVLGVERLSSPALTDHNSEPVRRLTAHALAENGTNVVITPLARMLQNEIQKPANAEEGEEERSQEVIRATAAGLGRTGEADAARPLFAALGAEPNLQDTILDALEKSTSATDLAVLLPEAPNVEVKRAIVTLLAKSHDRRVADALAGLVTDEDLDVRSTAALALAQFGDARAKEALYGLTQLEDNDDLVSDALEHLRYVVDASDVSRLADLIEALPFRRAAILRALGATDSAAAVRPIAAQLDGDDMRAAALSLGDLNADEGFRDLLRMVERPQNVEMAATNAADRSLVNEELLAKRRAAIMAMGRFGRTDAVEALMTVVDDNLDDYELRSLAAAAIGQVADADTIARVIEKVGAPSTNDNAKRYYVQALWQRPHAELNAQLLGVLRSNVIGEVKRAAALALGYAADPANDAALMTMLDDEALRRNAAFAITLGGGDEAVQKLITVLAADRDLREVLQQNVMNSENDWFNLLTGEMFETGAIWRRMRAAQLLRDGDGERSYAYPWAKTMAVLRTGWEGAGGMRAMAIRDKLWEALSGEDPVRRELAAEALGDLPEISLLLRARDRGGDAEAAARAVLQADAAS